MIAKKLLTATTTAMVLLAISFTHTARSHDIDIYVGSPKAKPEPMVFLTIDYNSNLGSVVCNGGECDELIKNNYLILPAGQTKIYFFDMMRAVIKKVLDDLGGFKIGLILNHANNANCAGPSATNCSNGAMIYFGLQSVTAGTDKDTSGLNSGGTFNPADYTSASPLEDANKIAFYKALDAMPLPGGTVNHDYQGSEIYFELFRYLSGQAAYNNHNGWTDFGSGKTLNLNDVDKNGDGINDITDTDFVEDNPLLGLTPQWDTSIEYDPAPSAKDKIYKGYYISPLRSAVATDCTSTYVINFMFGVNQNDADSNAAISNSKASGGMSIDTAANAVNTAINKQRFQNVLRWLHDIDLADGTFAPADYTYRPGNLKGQQNVTSYFLINTPSGSFTAEQLAWADAGGTGRPLALTENPDELEEKLRSFFSNILSVATTFVAPSIAVNVYNRAEIQKDLYIATFEAEKKGLAAWSGNIKKFNIDLANKRIIDALGNDAINPLDGRINNTALSFWTDPAQLLPKRDTNDPWETGADGRFIERGGCGSRIPGYLLSCGATSCSNTASPGNTNPALGTTMDQSTARMVFTDPASIKNILTTTDPSTDLRALNVDTTLANDPVIMKSFGVATGGNCTDLTDTSDTACNMIRYARGLNDDETPRNWLFGDPLHSKPVAVNYGAVRGHVPENPDIRIFVGANDGMLHMINNTMPGVPSLPSLTGDGKLRPVENGVEGWAYMPLETMKIIPSLRAGIGIHKYGVDSPPAVAVFDKNNDGNISTTASDGEFVYLYFGLRRGGRALYAMDITDPDRPKIRWKIDNTTPGFSELGYTWSEPVVTQMLWGGQNTSRPVIIIGGGFDENKDDNTLNHPAAPGGPDSMGRAVFIIDGNSGDLVWKTAFHATLTGADAANKTYWVPGMLHSIPSRVAAADSDGNGLTDRIYVGDTGGNIWRIDTKANDPFESGNEWQTRLFFVGGVDNSGTPVDRRFFYNPDYVQSRDKNDNPYDAIAIGTGNRAHPTDLTSDDYFYVIRDYVVESGVPVIKPLAHGDLEDVTSGCLNNGSCTASSLITNGWKMKMSCPWQSAAEPCGAKVLAPAFTANSEIFFPAYQPANGSATTSCKPSEGDTYLYTVDLWDATATRDYDSTTAGLTKEDTYSKSASPGIGAETTYLGGDKILNSGKGGPENVDIKGGYRTYWHKNKSQ